MGLQTERQKSNPQTHPQTRKANTHRDRPSQSKAEQLHIYIKELHDTARSERQKLRANTESEGMRGRGSSLSNTAKQTKANTHQPQTNT